MGGDRRGFGPFNGGAVIGITFLVATLGNGLPAIAASPACDEVSDRIANWVEEEAEHGLTTSRLAALQELVPLFVECTEAGLTGYEGVGSEVERWRDLVEVYFDDGDIDRVMCLMEKESGGNSKARNQSSGAAGLMQVMPSWAEVFGYTSDELFDPSINLWIASQILEKQGWVAWNPYVRGSCR